MADYVVTATLQDGISDPANAAAAAMDKAAASADQLTASVQKIGPSAQALVNRFDDTTRSANAYQRATDALAKGQDTLTIALAEGRITQDQYNGAMDGLRTKVAAARDAMANTVPVAGALTDAHGVAGKAATGAAMAHAGFTRELVVLGHEVVVGNYNRIPGSMMVLAERTGNLNQILSTLGGIVFGWPGLFAAAAGALAYMGYSAESQARRLGTLQAALMATRDDYAAMAAEAMSAARATAGYGGFSRTDTTTAAQDIASQPSFQGTTAQLESLIRISADLATVWDQKLPQAAETLAKAMSDPAAEADQLAKAHFPGMTAALVDNIKALADSGDKAGAFGLILDDVKTHVSGAATATKTDLQLALENLGHAFHDAGSDGKSMGQVIGDAVREAAAAVINALADITTATNEFRARMAQGGVLANPIAGPTGAGDMTGTTGNVLTSSAGALGIMQLMPGTAAAMHVNPLDASQNIYGGLAYLQQLLQHGDVAHALTTYGGFPSVGAASGYIGRVNAADPGILNGRNVTVGGQTMTVAQAIVYWGQILGLSPDVIALGQRIAVVESGGHQFAASSPAALPLPPLPGLLSPNGVAGGALSGSGVTNPPQALVDQALAAADKSGTAQAAGSAAYANIRLYQDALATLAAQGDTTSDSVVRLQQALQKSQVEFYNAVGPAAALVRQLDAQVAGNDAVAAAWLNGAAAAGHATNEIKAQAEALKFAAPGTQQYIDVVAALAAAYDQVTASQQGVQAAQQAAGQAQQLQYLQAEASTIGESADARARGLAVLKEQQNIESKLPGIEEAQKHRLLDNAAAIADATTELQRQQQTLSTLSSAFTSAFDTIGNAMAQAFVQGQGAAVNWGNVTKAVVEQILQEFLKLAILNPILNSAFGQNNTTISDVAGVLGGSSGGSGGILSNLGSLSSLGRLFTSGGSLSSGLDSFGASILPGVFTTPTDSALAGLGPGVFGPATADQVAAAGFNPLSASGFGSFSNVLGIAGAALPGLMSGNYAQAGAGVAGAALGTFLLPGVGTVIGGLAGNLLGSQFGPPPKHAFSQTDIGLANGLISIGASAQQLDASSLPQTSADAATINAALTALNVTIASLGRITQIGQNTPGGFQDPTKAASLSDAFAGFGFTSADPVLNRFLSGQSFASLAALQSAVQSFETLVNTTIPALEKYNDVTGSMNAAVTAIEGKFQSAIDAAQKYGLATDALTAAQQQATQAAVDAANKSFYQQDVGFYGSYLTAAATVSGSPADSLAAQLYTFDYGTAPQSRDKLSADLVNTYGDSVRQTASYAQQMAALEQSLGEQRLAIVQQYNDKLLQTAGSAVASLASYARSLEFGSGSPLSAVQQYALAGQYFHADAAGVSRGDFTSLTDLQSAASTFLSSSSTVNGSGAKYVADFNSVLDALRQAATLTPDTLTAGVLQAETRTQTAQLLDSQSKLLDALNTINATLKGTGAPARIVT